jgi:hypothetical protein
MMAIRLLQSAITTNKMAVCDIPSRRSPPNQVKVLVGLDVLTLLVLYGSEDLLKDE